MDLVPVPFGWCRAVVTDRDGKEVEHQVRVGDLHVGADETAGLEVVGDSRTATEQPLKSDNRGPPPCEHRRERNRLFTRVLDVDLQMILKVLTHSREMDAWPDACSFEIVTVADA